MKKDEIYYLIGMDGGASKTRAVLFTDKGDTIAKIIDKGTNLSLNPEIATNIIADLVNGLAQKADIAIDNIDAIGLGIAGSSNQNGRDMVFGKLDNMQLSARTLIMNDAEAAYHIGCPGDSGILVTVGTGIICMSRDIQGKTIRQAGKGHDQGDVGSGYWIGRQAILNLTLNETSVIGDIELEEIMKIFLLHIEEDNFQNAMEKLNESNNTVYIVAGMAEKIINIAENGNEIALSIIQEGSHAVSEYILSLVYDLNYGSKEIILSGNGSIIKNNFFRQSVNDELKFNFSDIKWTFSKLSPAYGAGLLAGKVHNIDVHIPDILKGDILAPA
jgi:N-acetylglucosamine kinase-like BadF-type ATPase